MHESAFVGAEGASGVVSAKAAAANRPPTRVVATAKIVRFKVHVSSGFRIAKRPDLVAPRDALTANSLRQLGQKTATFFVPPRYHALAIGLSLSVYPQKRAKSAGPARMHYSEFIAVATVPVARLEDISGQNGFASAERDSAMQEPSAS